MTPEIITRRLTIIKHLYNIGVDQSKANEAVAFTSLLSFHDAIDLFMQLAAEYRGILNKEKKQFAMMQFFDHMSDLDHKAAVKRINDRRNSLKHNGQIPAKVDIEECRTIAGLFFNDNTSKVLVLNSKKLHWLI